MRLLDRQGDPIRREEEANICCSAITVAEIAAGMRAALEALIARESALRLAALGGTERQLRPIRRRRGGKRA
jgi:hypothetical protein